MSAETESTGRVRTEATIENLMDLWDVRNDRLSPGRVRRIRVTDAQVNARVTLLALPTRYIKELGLSPVTAKRVTSSKGEAEATLYEPVRLTIRDRCCTMDVMEVSDEVPVLIGRIPLTALDFVVDLRSRTLIGNPAHGGEHVYELY